MEYAELGMIGVVAVLFTGLIKFLQTTLIAKVEEVKGVTIKLIDRWNFSDKQADDRHEKLLEELSKVKEDLNYLKGRAT